jgi:hypothetical protein
MKKAIPVRMPDWDEGDFPTSKQLELYLFNWERRRNPLAPDPGIGVSQKSFWLDPEDLDVEAYEAECLRAGRPDRALFIRRLIATYHKPRTSRPTAVTKPPVPWSAPQAELVRPRTIAGQALERAPAPTAVRERELSAAQVNEISRLQGLGICWQPGNVYRIGRTAAAKSCLIQIDAQGKELAKYGSW